MEIDMYSIFASNLLVQLVICLVVLGTTGRLIIKKKFSKFIVMTIVGFIGCNVALYVVTSMLPNYMIDTLSNALLKK